MKKSKKVLIIIVAVLVLFSAYRIISANVNSAEEEKYLVNVKTDSVSRMDLETTSPLTGTIQAENQVVLAAGLQAEVTGVYVEVGDYVTAGTTLVSGVRRLQHGSGRTEYRQDQLRSHEIPICGRRHFSAGL